MRENICDEYCDGCAYLNRAGGTVIRCCNYYLTTGAHRPCPAGTGCIVKRSGKKQIQWSKENAERWQNLKEKRQKQKPEKKKRIAQIQRIICKGCGKPFVPEDPRRLYCCEECREKAREERRKEYAMNRKSHTGKGLVRTAVCPECGTIFETTIQTKMFCSTTCKNRAAARRHYQKRRCT